MSWQRAPVVAALVAAFSEAAEHVAVFKVSPATVNPPALVCVDPVTVTKRTSAMSVDQTDFAVTAIVALDQADELSALLDTADSAVMADPTLGKTVWAATPIEYRNFRLLTIGGAEYRAADLIIRIDL